MYFGKRTHTASVISLLSLFPRTHTPALTTFKPPSNRVRCNTIHYTFSIFKSLLPGEKQIIQSLNKYTVLFHSRHPHSHTKRSAGRQITWFHEPIPLQHQRLRLGKMAKKRPFQPVRTATPFLRGVELAFQDRHRAPKPSGALPLLSQPFV